MSSESSPEVPKTIADDIRPLWKAAKDRVGNVGEFMARIVARSQELKDKYPDAAHRRAYHSLIGSTLMNEPGIIEEDFPGDDSVITFLEKLGH
jgi:hypothetical protein